jgi:hypothetical protein
MIDPESSSRVPRAMQITLQTLYFKHFRDHRRMRLAGRAA